MAEKLKLVLRSLQLHQRSQLLLFLKTLTFGILLFIASAGNFGVLPVLFFAAVSFLLYFRPSFVGPYHGRYAFVILIFVSILGMRIMADSILLLPGILLFSLVFYLITGIKEILFVKRSRIYYIAALILFYTLFVIFFLADKSDLYLLKYGGTVIASFFLFREWLSVVSAFHFPKREFIAAMAAVFIAAQLLWAVALLPIGFIAAANLMLVFMLILGNFLFVHFTGNLTKDFIIGHTAMFAVLILLIFRFSY